MRFSVKVICLFGLCCTAACNSAQPNAGYVASQLVSASQGGSVTVTEAQNSALAGTTIQIPPAALSKDTAITIRVGQPLPLVDGMVSAGAVAEFGPDGITFAYPATITLPYQLAAGAAVSDLAVWGVEADGTVLVVDNADLTIDVSTHTVAFAAAGFTRFGPASGRGGAPCPPGTFLCGCCGSGKCLAKTIACPLLCPAIACRGGGTCCPAGEYFCGCGGDGICIPDDLACPLACPAATPTPITPNPTCCPAGEYFCGCFGEGTCIPDNQVCPATCPVCDPGNPTAPPCPSNEICLNGKCVPVLGGDGGSPICDPNTPCPSGETCCGCCGRGICLPAGQACPVACPAVVCPPPRCDPANGISCPNGDTCCPGCCGSPGLCVPAGQTCPALNCPVCPPPPDAGVINTCQPTSTGATGCPAGDVCCPGCCGSPGLCVPAGQACPALMCPVCLPPPSDGGFGQRCDPSGATNLTCPKGETCCGCGSFGYCLPTGTPCPLLCPGK